MAVAFYYGHNVWKFEISAYTDLSTNSGGNHIPSHNTPRACWGLLALSLPPPLLFLSLSLSPSNSQLLQCTAANIIIIVILSQFFKWPYIFIILLSCRLFDQPVIVMASVFVLLPHHMACRWRQLVPRSRQLKGKKLESSLLILYIYRHISTMHADAIV